MGTRNPRNPARRAAPAQDLAQNLTALTDEALDALKEAAYQDGLTAAYTGMLTLLERQYLGKNPLGLGSAPKRGTPQARALLELAGRLAQDLRDKLAQRGQN